MDDIAIWAALATIPRMSLGISRSWRRISVAFRTLGKVHRMTLLALVLVVVGLPRCRRSGGRSTLIR